MPGATSSTWLVAGSASCRMFGRLGGRVRRLENRCSVVLQFRDALAYVTEGSMRARLSRCLRALLREPPLRQLFDRRHVDRAVVQVLLDLGEVLGEETAVGSDRVAAQWDCSRLGHVELDV